MSFYAEVRKTDDLVIGVRERTAADAAQYPSGAEAILVEITRAQFDLFHSTGAYYNGSAIYRYKWVSPNLVTNPDTRPTVTFTPERIKADVDEVISVQIDHSDGLDGLIEFFLAGSPMRINFTTGTAMGVVIDTSKAIDFRVVSQAAFQIPTPLHVTVYSAKISRES